MPADEEPIATTLATTDYPYLSTRTQDKIDNITNTTEHGTMHVCHMHVNSYPQYYSML